MPAVAVVLAHTAQGGAVTAKLLVEGLNGASPALVPMEEVAAYWQPSATCLPLLLREDLDAVIQGFAHSAPLLHPVFVAAAMHEDKHMYCVSQKTGSISSGPTIFPYFHPLLIAPRPLH